MGKTPLELRRHDCDCKVGGTAGCGVDGNVVCDINSYLIDSEANGVQVPSKAFVFTSIFLHQTYYDRAAVLSIMRIVIFFLQLDHILRI